MTTWTAVDNSGAGLPLTVTESNYEQNGDEVLIQLNLTYPSTPDTSVAKVSLPVTQVANSPMALAVGYDTSGSPVYAQALNSNVKFYADPSSTTALRNVDLSGASLDISGTYFAA